MYNDTKFHSTKDPEASLQNLSSFYRCLYKGGSIFDDNLVLNESTPGIYSTLHMGPPVYIRNSFFLNNFFRCILSQR
jgi:hypothetical protein